MPNIYKDVNPDGCAPQNCTPFGEYYHVGEVTLCVHDAIYFCREWTTPHDLRSEAAKRWYKLSPWFNWWKYPKAEKLLKPSVQTE